MDIKMVWVVEHRRHACTLTIIDTFTRAVLYRAVGYHMRQAHIHHAWQQIIADYLQPHDLLNRALHVELSNDNGPQLAAKTVRDFLHQNHIRQVFTHPCTPQENGHVESFHYTLKKAFGDQPSFSLQELENRLDQFYANYNTVRIHNSVAWLAPRTFWECWSKGLIERTGLEKK